MNIEEIKTRLSNLDEGKVIKYDHAMNLATQYMVDYKNDVTYLLSIIEEALKHSNGAPYESSFENKYRLLEVRNILQGDE